MQRISAPLAGTWGQVVIIKNYLIKIYLQSFLCNAGFDVELWNEDQDKFVTINLARLQIQPHKVPEDTFANPVICEEGKSFCYRISFKFFCFRHQYRHPRHRRVNSWRSCSRRFGELF